MATSHKDRLKCVTPALLTPLHKDGSLDEASLKKLINRVVSAGMKTLFMLGYTGEVRALKKEERQRVIEVTRATAGPDAYIIAGCLGDSSDIIEEHCQVAYEAGADMVLITPTDFFHLNDTELEGLFVRLNQTVQLPIMIYNCPENQHYVSAEMLARLAKLDKIQALKQSTSTDKVQKILLTLDPKDNFIMVSGDEFEYFPAMCLGVEGFIMGGPGNITPKTCIDILDAYQGGKFEESRKMYLDFVSFYDELYNSLPYDVISVIKATMEIAGVCERWMKHPTMAVSDEDMLKIKDMIKRHNIKL